MKRTLLLLLLIPIIAKSEEPADFFSATLLDFKESIGSLKIEQREKMNEIEALSVLFPLGSSEDDSIKIISKIIKNNESTFWIEKKGELLNFGKSYDTPEGIHNWWVRITYSQNELESAEIWSMSGGPYFTPERLSSSKTKKIISNQSVDTTAVSAPR